MEVEVYLTVKRGPSTWTLTLATTLRQQRADAGAQPAAPSPQVAPRREAAAGTGGAGREGRRGGRAPEREGSGNPRAGLRRLAEIALWLVRLLVYLGHRGGLFS